MAGARAAYTADALSHQPPALYGRCRAAALHQRREIDRALGEDDPTGQAAATAQD